MTNEVKILIGIATAVVIGGVMLAIFANPQPEAPGAPVDEQSLIRDNSHMTGNRDAKVTLVEFGDFQCPACAQAHPNVKLVLDNYKDNPDVNFVFRNFPLDAIHPNAHIASEAAEAAGAQDKFFEMHDLLYERQTEWSVSQEPLDIFAEYASQLELDVDKFKAAVSQRLYADIINADYSDGTAIGVNSTPTFFLNGEKLSGFNPEEVIGRIDAILSGEVLEGDDVESVDGDSPIENIGKEPEDVNGAMEAQPPEQGIDQLPPNEQPEN